MPHLNSAAEDRNISPVRQTRSAWLRRLAVVGAITAVFGSATYFAKGTGLRTRLIGPPNKQIIPRVGFVLLEPADGATNVPVDTPIVARLRKGRTLDPKTLNRDHVYLLRVADQKPVDIHVIQPDGQSLAVSPLQPLEPRTQYALFVSHSVRTAEGRPVFDNLTSFTTGGPIDPDLKFNKTALPASQGTAFTCLRFGPDGALWASSVDGRMFRFAIEPDGKLLPPTIYTALQQAEHGPRLLTGFCFDPLAPADTPALIVTHAAFGFENMADFTGKVSRISGPALNNVQDLVIDLPRSSHDHATNQPSVGPDGAIYFSQPSNSATGFPDEYWGKRPEHRLNSSILRLDLTKLPRTLPVDARTPDCGGSYDPDPNNAPLTVYCTGVRLSYDLLWHSNGHLFGAVNGASAGGNTPTDPTQPGTQLYNLSVAENDWLFDLKPGAYYGHPNPSAGHFILNGGHPGGGFKFGEVTDYPLGTHPDAAWRPATLCLGQHVSANGLIEYHGPACGGKLDGRILACRYSRGGDVLVMTVNSTGQITDQQFGLPGLSGFNRPLDLTQNPTNGDLYISEFGGKCITLVRPLQ